jgi:hypothetical protein
MKRWLLSSWLRRLRWRVPLSFALVGAVPVFAAEPEEPFTELPILGWQQEMELQSTVRQIIFNTYLPFLARNTDYRGVHNDAIPHQAADWDWQRDDVQNQLRGRLDAVDAQRRRHAGIGDAEINAMLSRKQAFRPEQLEGILTSMPRFDDVIVKMERVQPLGATGGVSAYRCDFEVKTKSGSVVETTRFDAVDITYSDAAQSWLLPMRVLLEVAPLARAASSTQATGFDARALLGSAISVARETVRQVPFVGEPIDGLVGARVNALLPSGPNPAP